MEETLDENQVFLRKRTLFFKTCFWLFECFLVFYLFL